MRTRSGPFSAQPVIGRDVTLQLARERQDTFPRGFCMSDQPLERARDPLQVEFARTKGSSKLRLVTEDDPVVLPENAAPTDDAPTIISKNKPTEEAVKAAPPQLSGSLRGRRLAHFELIEPIGVGGMAAVLRARDTQLDRFVALKILPPDMAQDEENVRRFHQEARAAAKLDHENIARVYFCGEDQRLHFIAFEFVEGENLRTVLEKRGRLPVAEAVRIVLQIATGLEHAAARGVVHRDVKPSNIILSSNGRAKLVDMGLARSLEPHNDQGLTQSGVTLGTFDYISPEQALEPREADSRSDLYSLGCTFYHMLTGQPPVPEGTAAKKLHHHQHVPPVDPRQLNPEIPDEVAVVLGRMMAKDPKDRYQRPVELVQHLMQVAQKVGAGDDAPEGVLFVDAPLPGVERKRPLLLVAAAAFGLALVLVLLSLAPGQRSPLLPWSGRAAPGEKGPSIKENPVVPIGRPALDARAPDVKSAEDLAQALKEKWPKAVLKGDVQLGDTGLVFEGDASTHLVVQSSNPFEPKTIRVKHQPRADSGDLAAGIILDGGIVTFKNIVFEIEASATPESVCAALAIKGSGSVQFVRCKFVQPKLPLQPFIGQDTKVVPISCVLVQSEKVAPEVRPRIEFDGCYFTGGQVAVAINGPAELNVKDCGFKPYAALFHLRGHTGKFGVAVKLQECSAFVMHGPAFRLDRDATCVLSLQHSVFSRPEPVFGADPPNLIYQTESIEPAVRFESFQCVYHNLNSLWVREDRTNVPLLLSKLDDDFRQFVATLPQSRGDTGSVQLPGSLKVWATAAAWEKDAPEAVFALNPEVAELRKPGDPSKGLGRNMGSLPALARTTPSGPTFKLEVNQKLVDPDADDTMPRVYRTIYSALASAAPGDVILIKEGKVKDGDNRREVPFKPIRLDGPVDVTLKPFPGHAPVLIMPDTTEDDAAFLRLIDGKVVLEQLELVLEPDQEGFKAQSVCLVGGNASCTFRSCVVTMKPTDKVRHAKRVPLSVVTLMDPEEAMMKMPSKTPRTAPELVLQNCFIRGEGELVYARASRAIDVMLDNTLVALTGSLLQAFGAAKEAPSEHAASFKLMNVSLFLGEPLLALRAGKNVKGLVQTKMEPRDSLFAPLAERPFVLLEANETTEDGLQPYLDWKGERNAYCTYEKMLECRRAEDLQASLSLDPARWVDLFREAGSRFVRGAPFAAPPRQLWTALPEHFLPRSDFKDELSVYGVNLDLLPRLVAGKTAE